MIRRTVPQKTISKESSLSGVGLHTGENVTLTLSPHHRILALYL